MLRVNNYIESRKLITNTNYLEYMDNKQIDINKLLKVEKCDIKNILNKISNFNMIRRLFYLLNYFVYFFNNFKCFSILRIYLRTSVHGPSFYTLYP